MREHAFCFIVCEENAQYFEECMFYLERLIIPEGYEAEVLGYRDTENMATAYNECMYASDAQYKIYIGKNTFLIQQDFLLKTIEIFQADEKIGMLGVSGMPRLNGDALAINGERRGRVYASELQSTLQEGDYEEVEALDGVLMVTRYDIPWREDLFLGRYFYDISQSLEFCRRGYRCVVPRQETEWCIQPKVLPEPTIYEQSRKKLLQEYANLFEKRERGKRILCVSTETNSEFDFAWALLELGYEAVYYGKTVEIMQFKIQQADELAEELKNGDYLAIITYDFSAAIAQAAQDVGVKYLAWAWDAPLHSLYDPRACYDTNYIFVFDRREKERLEQQKIPHLFHLPLATNITHGGAMVISPEDEQKYAGDVTFVAGLYNMNLYHKLSLRISKETKQEIDTMYQNAMGRWDGVDRIHHILSEEALTEITAANNGITGEKMYGINNRFYYESMLARNLTHLERVRMLNRLAERFTVTLYTGSETSELHRVLVKPRVSYLDEMPKVFHLSKINLNITLRSIESGIPLRILDIMGVGGFVMTNYQEELEEMFEPDKDIVYFRDERELLKKTEYYLRHEKERLQIAMNGYKKVREKYSYLSQLKKIFEMSHLEEKE